jgi:hypothetical protein
MALFTAYFDASGNAQDQAFVVVAGYIANFMQWRAFDGMWKQIHDEHGVLLPFHMAEFQSAHANPKYETQKNARPDYVAISKDPKRGASFFQKLCKAQQSMVNCGISCIVEMKIYDNISSLLDLRSVVPPYALAARSCMARVHEWEEQFAIEESVECIFEAGDFEQKKFTELVESEGGPSPIYKDKKDCAGLQAADHYAWEQFQDLKRERGGQRFPMRGSFLFLLNAIPKAHLVVTPEGLINLCHKKGIDPRTGVKR